MMMLSDVILLVSPLDILAYCVFSSSYSPSPPLSFILLSFHSCQPHSLVVGVQKAAEIIRGNYSCVAYQPDNKTVTRGTSVMAAALH